MSNPTMRLPYTGVARPQGRWHASGGGRHAHQRIRAEQRDWMGPTAPLWPTAPPGTPAPPMPASWPAHLLIDDGLRERVVSRMRRVSVKHTQHAWDRRRQDPISPHAVVFCYADPDSAGPGPRRSPRDGRRPPYHAVRVATRLFLAGPEAAESPQLLRDLALLAGHHATTGGLDPRLKMADRCDPMTPAAVYLGVGVSTLDTPGMTWEHAQQSAASIVDVPGQCLAYLADGSLLTMDRGVGGRLGRFDVRMAYSPAGLPGPAAPDWRNVLNAAGTLHPPTVPAAEWLQILHRIIAEAHDGPR